VKDNNEYLGIFHLLKWIFQNEFFIRWTCVEMAKVLTTVSLGALLEWKRLPIKNGLQIATVHLLVSVIHKLNYVQGHPVFGP